MQSIQSLLKAAKIILFNTNIDAKEQTYRDFCTCLLELIKKPQSYLMTNQQDFIPIKKYQKIVRVLKRLANNEPIELIQKKALFNTLYFAVNVSVLIPREDSLVLLEATKKQITTLIKQGRKKITLSDLGTGCGNLAISMALFLQTYQDKNQLESFQIIATDLSKKALKIAKKNERNLLKNQSIQWLKSDWMDEFEHQYQPYSFDLILSNPPYIATDDPLVQASTRYEPSLALFSENNGLKDIEKIIIQAKKWLKKEGVLLIEHGYQQKDEINQLLKKNDYQIIDNIQDQNLLNRVSLSKKVK